MANKDKSLVGRGGGIRKKTATKPTKAERTQEKKRLRKVRRRKGA